METTLDYFDIQGNVLVNYADLGFFKARYLFFKILDVDQGRDFVREICKHVTPASACMGGKVASLRVATNISFSYMGLRAIGVPVLTLQSFPEEFIIGMRGQRKILGDDEQSNPEYWDAVWNQDAEDEGVHIFISIDASNEKDLEERYNLIRKIESDTGGVRLMDGHRSGIAGQLLPYQEASVLYDANGNATPKEHFGYTDGISNPFFKGMTPEMGDLLGGGKKNNYGNPEDESTWAPLETGEFILGYQDEAQEYPAAPTPPLIARNGSFLVYNKFHEYVDRFDAYLEREGADFPGGKEALAAKFVGRWRNGAPISKYPTWQAAEAIANQRQNAQAQIAAAKIAQNPAQLKIALDNFRAINKNFIAFDYRDDPEGGRCPMGAHIRRANPRGGLEFENQGVFETPSALDNRRRMIRRGLPYGVAKNRAQPGGEHGTVIMTIVASIKRQFEFVVQQWLNYGNDFKLANDKDPIMGNHKLENGQHNGRMIVEGRKGESDPYFLSGIPRFIETRGGEYFFHPSITAVRLIGEGIVDPT